MGPEKIVVDTSVVIKWFKHRDEPFYEQAEELKARYLNGEVEIAVPELIFYELGNVLLLKCELTEEEAVEKIESFWKLLPIAVFLSVEFVKKIMSFSFKYEVTFYDACFAVLARELGCGFITADKKLFDKLRDVKFVRFLGTP